MVGEMPWMLSRPMSDVTAILLYGPRTRTSVNDYYTVACNVYIIHILMYNLYSTATVLYCNGTAGRKVVRTSLHMYIYIYTVNRIIYTFSIIVISSGVHDVVVVVVAYYSKGNPCTPWLLLTTPRFNRILTTGRGRKCAHSLFQPSVRKCSFNVPLSN